MSGQTERVQPGDLITSELMNRLLSRLEALEQATLKLGSLGAGTHTLVALGAGFEASAGIWLDGVQLLSSPASRGINLVILSSGLTVKFQRSYDTWGTTNAANDLANDLITRTAQGDIVAAVTRDAYLLNLNTAAKSALAAVGAASLGEPGSDTRANAAFIGVAPANKGTVRYNYLVSVMPADSAGFASALLAAPPFAWGVYSVPLQRFLLGGAAGSPVEPLAVTPPGGTKDLEKLPDNFKVIQDTKAFDAKLTDGVKLTDAVKTTDVKVTDAKLTDAKLTDAVKTTDAKLTDAKLTDAVKTTDAKLTDAKLTDAVKTTDAKLTDAVKTTDAKATDAKLTDAKLTDAVKATDAKATDAKLTDAKLTDAKLADLKATDRGASVGPSGPGAVDEPPAGGSGQAFILPEERPQVDAAVVQSTEPKKNARRSRKPA